MCGILGIIGSKYVEGEKALKSISHRGPDAKGVFIDKKNKVFLGHVRLSIIDATDNSNQPMTSECGNYTIIFNGEIYNYSKLKFELQQLGVVFKTNSDTEVVLNSYIYYGDSCTTRFIGMFAFSIYDLKRNEVFISRDRFGIKPLVYHCKDGLFSFSSELKPLMICNEGVSINISAIDSFFQYGSVNQPETVFKDCFTLMPGHSLILNIAKTTFVIKRYYDLREKIEPVKYGTGNFGEDFFKLLDQVVEDHMISDFEPAIYLSGGIDSTVLTAITSKKVGKLRTFSLGFGKKTGLASETDIATRSSEFYGTVHQNFIVPEDGLQIYIEDYFQSMDQPSFDGFNTYLISLFAKRFGVKVALSGLGADEYLCGYSFHRDILSRYQRKKPFIRNLMEIFPKNRWNLFNSFFDRDISESINMFRSLSDSSYDKFKSLTYGKFIEGITGAQQIAINEFDNYLLNTLLRDSDNYSMANSIELRPVFLDHRLVEYGLNMEDRYKFNSLKGKIVLRNLPIDIPNEVLHGKKKGFNLPFDYWLNNTLNSLALDFAYSMKYDDINFEEYIKRLKVKACTYLDWRYFVLSGYMTKAELSFENN